MSDWQIYCSVCGAPINSGTGLPKWLDDTMLLTSAHKTEYGMEIDAYFPSRPLKYGPYPFNLGHNPPDISQRSFLRLSAHSKDGTRVFDLLDSGEQVFALWLRFVPHPGGPRHGAPIYIPVHRLCLQIADKFIESTKTSLILAGTPDNGLISTMNLWEILHRRLPSTPDGHWIIPLPEPHNYYGGTYCHGEAWEPEDREETFEHDPFDIPNLTSSLLENLTPAPPPTPTDNRSWYISALHNGHLLPWLFDLDVTQILEKEASGHWDWKGLIQRLMIPSIHEYDNTSLNLPLGLRNRRRIWRMLEEARVHDVAGEAEARDKLWKEAEERVRKECVWKEQEQEQLLKTVRSVRADIPSEEAKEQEGGLPKSD